MNPILIIKDAGHGETPPYSAAKFKPGDIVKVRRLKWLRHLPDRGAIAAIVPPGFPAEYAIADASGMARPLMITAPSRALQYIVAFDGNPRPCLIRESALLPSGEAPVPVQWGDVSAQEEASG